ncbi:hypothetical protein BO71DRAFT_335403 [Aspergillus ellipticus CBS 707.79]|uniref:Elongation of fatty acids protein n=1 Tax=Aspergillus ellipticus CBS 707.79 TaxID=1448320 RepID=A0A319DPM1_9EURO|nr:hypothetical protein BO71DRAFT_335403 [Aspergillus ellipticus CBS 707.79]
MYDFTVDSDSAVIHLGFPPASLLKFPPSELPATVPAPLISEPTWFQPFNIPPTLYNQVLDVRVPITIASVYAVTVVLVNRLNKSRGYKPYAFSQTALFKLFVILHNIFLAVYSAWTFVGMIHAFRNSWPSRDDPNYVAAVADTLCKVNGPRGYGNAATYDPSVDQWTFRNPDYRLAAGGIPDSSDVGRLWNEGLGYLGWIFYLSKFYEVLDTVIILAKGKKSSTLQTYHHAGAMMCMWAGIRYVAPPIWIFTQVNSGIHALMYTYYTLTALRFRIPNVIKRSLTTMQITQFIIGSAMAASYLFWSYTLPLDDSAVLPPVDAAAVAAGAAGAGLVPWLKKVAFRAAGAEGIAENVGVPDDSAAARVLRVGPMVTCMDTTGQGFAIWLNVMYLLPLTYLFARFFVRSYLYRKDPGPQRPTSMHAAEKAGLDALKGVSREIRKAAEMSGETSEVTEDEAVNKVRATAKAQQKNADNSPIRTRATTAKQRTRVATSDLESDSGFSTVPSKKGAKKATKDEIQSSPSVVDPKGANPFEVLDRSA